MLRSPTHLVGGHGPTSAAKNSHHVAAAVNGGLGVGGGGGGRGAGAGSGAGATTRTNLMANGNATTGATTNNSRSSPRSSHNSTTTTTTRTSLFDSCHRKIRLIGGGPVAFLGGLVAKARRKERDGDQSSTDTKLYLEESVLERKLPDADLKALVDLPAGLDYNEWLASHIETLALEGKQNKVITGEGPALALFEHVNLVYGTISEFCTTSGCPDMTGPGNRTYLWFDEKGKKTRVAAPQYIDYVMTFTQKTVSDESIFPTKYANEFPSSFESIARKILRLQFHVIAHLYAAHFREIALLGLHTHLNLTFAHLTALHRRFNLIDEKETDVLRDLEIALRLTDDGSTSTLQGSEAGLVGAGGGGGGGGGGVGGGASVPTTGPGGEEASLIDGDASVEPICTQPEAMKGLSDQSDIRGGAGGGDCDGGYCSSGSTTTNGGGSLCPNSSHIGGVMNFNNNNSNHSSTHPNTTSSLLQCNSSNSSSSTHSHTTTTA